MKTNTSEADERAIERLKKTKVIAIEQLADAGKSAGMQYVQTQAHWAELDRLERWYENLGMDTDRLLEDISIRQVVDVLDEDNGKDIENCLRDAHGHDIDSPAWVNGFILGALSKFDELKSALD